MLNADGRSPDGPLYDNASLKKGTYRLVFDVAAYFRARGVDLPEPPFLDRVTLDFGMAHADAALPRAAAGEPVELFDVPGVLNSDMRRDPHRCGARHTGSSPGWRAVIADVDLRAMTADQSWPSVSVSSWKRPLLCHSQVSV